jgi:hypothetical protein
VEGIHTTPIDSARVAMGQHMARYDVLETVMVLEACQPEGHMSPGEKVELPDG